MPLDYSEREISSGFNKKPERPSVIPSTFNLNHFQAHLNLILKRLPSANRKSGCFAAIWCGIWQGFSNYKIQTHIQTIIDELENIRWPSFDEFDKQHLQMTLCHIYHDSYNSLGSEHKFTTLIAAYYYALEEFEIIPPNSAESRVAAG